MKKSKGNRSPQDARSGRRLPSLLSPEQEQERLERRAHFDLIWEDKFGQGRRPPPRTERRPEEPLDWARQKKPPLNQGQCSLTGRAVLAGRTDAVDRAWRAAAKLWSGACGAWRSQRHDICNKPYVAMRLGELVMLGKSPRDVLSAAETIRSRASKEQRVNVDLLLLTAIEALDSQWIDEQDTAAEAAQREQKLNAALAFAQRMISQQAQRAITDHVTEQAGPQDSGLGPAAVGPAGTERS